MKRIAYGSEAIVVIPVAIEVVQVQLTLRVPVVEVRNVAVAITVVPDRSIMCNMPSSPPPLEYSRGCILFGIVSPPAYRTKYLH